jgi:hypothetical protein
LNDFKRIFMRNESWRGTFLQVDFMSLELTKRVSIVRDVGLAAAGRHTSRSRRPLSVAIRFSMPIGCEIAELFLISWSATPVRDRYAQRQDSECEP